MPRIFILIVAISILQCPTETFAKVNDDWNHISFELDLFDWKEVDYLLPKYKIFNVIDIESGKSFQVQRRAGRDHADVQPLTERDTTMMKEIYGGKWSWRRKAILVQVDDYLIPGSMHGMPHGAGALQNNFPGHFCIHFYGSTTHKSDAMDYSHMLMILKSNGTLDQYIEDASMNEQLKIFIEALNQKDNYILDLVFTKGWKGNSYLLNIMEGIETIKIKEISTLPIELEEGLIIEQVNVEVTMYTQTEGLVKGVLFVQLSRSSPISQWRVHHDLVKLENIN